MAISSSRWWMAPSLALSAERVASRVSRVLASTAVVVEWVFSSASKLARCDSSAVCCDAIDRIYLTAEAEEVAPAVRPLTGTMT